MIKLMLVDDEQMTRYGLKQYVDWEDMGIEVVAEASDGVEALNRFADCSPDIVLCDVRMPRMDGLELAEKIRAVNPECKIVFMSGYSDTEYLKKAIKVSAVDYLEKPVQIKELAELLGKLAEQIRQTRQELRHFTDIQDKWNRWKSELTGRIIKQLLRLSSPADSAWESVKKELQSVHGDFPLEAKYLCCVFQAKKNEAWDTWPEDAQRAADSDGLQILHSVIGGIGVAILALETERDLEDVSLWINKLTAKGRTNGNIPMVVGVGALCHQLGAIQSSYNQALKAVQFRFYRGWNTAIWHRELPVQDGSANLMLFDKHSYIHFEEALRRQDFQAAIDLLDQAVNELLLFPQLDVEGVRKKLFRWYVALTKYYPESMWEFENDELWSSVFVSGELYTIRSFMMRRVEIIQESIDAAGRPSEKSVIREVIRFIHQNYYKNLSIASIASHVYLTPTYLCILFKKEKGLSINDYITQFRIEKAKQLLGDRSLKLYEISRMVGYQDPNYFAKVFRKITGLNPSEYRETMNEGIV